MHTFFINTSERDILSDKGIMDIEEVNRELIILNCPLKTWTDQTTGYVGCADRIGELIDNYREINNEFNLVIYIDLLSVPEYKSVFKKADETCKKACHYAYYSVISNLMKKTLIRELNIHARQPIEMIFIFEENDTEKTTLRIDNADDKEMLISEIAKTIGFPSSEQLDHILKEKIDVLFNKRDEINALNDSVIRTEERIRINISDEMVFLLADELNSVSTGAAFKEYYHYCLDDLRNLLARIVDNIDSKELRSEFIMRLFDSYRSERYSRDGFFYTSLITDSIAIGNNLTENLKRNLRIYFYLASCIREQTFIEPADANGEPLKIDDHINGVYCRAKDIEKIGQKEWLLIRDYLSEKNSIYKRKLELTLKMRESYTSIGLAPQLDVYDNEMFSLDPYGAGTGEGVKRLLDKETVEEFDYDGLEIVSKMKNKPKINGKKAEIMANEYIKAAHDLRNLHASYLDRIQEHIMTTLSGYAGSDDNSETALKKRIVNIDTNVINEEGTVCRYKKAGSDGETKKMVTVEKNAANAYSTMQSLFFEYCASHELAVSDISAQCDWLEERIKQIQASLKKIKQVGIVSMIVTMASFIPYIIIGWNTITSDIFSLFSAICSLAVPFVLFGAVFGAVVAWQKSKLKKVWDEFWSKHLKALESNKSSVLQYDRLLTAYVPALRYTYEYYLDVQFRRECEKLAESKLSHHIRKLQDRVDMTDKILSDLQLGTQTESNLITEKEYTIDYEKTYCTGKNNVALYSIFDDNAIKLIYKGRE